MPPIPEVPADVPMRLAVDEAQAHVLALCAKRRVAAESVPLALATGRVLANDVVAPHDLPPFANSAMDGYALHGAELPATGERRFRIVATMLAGATTAPAFGVGECVRIMTGAPLPPGADTVVVRENVHVEGSDAVIGPERTGANMRPAGEDYRAGVRALQAGTRLGAAQLGVLAAFGQYRVAVARRPRVALFVTGDELVAPGTPLAFGQIHDSNRCSLGALLLGLGIEAHPAMHLPDDPLQLREALRDAGERCDLIVSSGGVSAGDADLLPGLVTELGRVHFWKVRMKPGMPLLCGEIGRALMFALPGNPVSTITTFLAFVGPALLALQGAGPPRRWTARLATPLRKGHARTEFLRARLRCEDGLLQAEPVAQQGSAMLRGVADADALIRVPEEARELAAGATVEVLPLPGMWEKP